MKHKKNGPPKGQKHTDICRSPFGERLFRTRKARGLSQEELGAKACLSKRMISRYEGNFSGPPMEPLTRLAQALNVTISYLLGESTQKTLEPDIPPLLKKHIDKLKMLPPKEQKTILHMIELASRTGTND